MNAKQASQALHVESNATFDDIKSSYRKLVLELHPDKNPDNMDDEQFKKITVAYHVLKKISKEKNSSIDKNFEQNNQKSETKNKTTFSQKRTKWQNKEEKIPEEDWGKFTREFEEENPSFWKDYEKKFWQEYDEYVKKDGSKGEFDKTKEPKNIPIIDVDVDPSLCIACCSCVTIAPEVFEIDNARMNPKSHVINPKGAGFNKIMTAAETCPTKAIKIENKETNEKLYPW